MPVKPLVLPALLLSGAWLLQTAVLSVWFGAAYAPNVVLCVLLVFAVTDSELRFFWLAAFASLVLDVQNRLVIGSFTFGIPLCYLIVAAASRHLLRSDRIYVSLPILYLAIRLFLHVWIFAVGFVAGFLGWELRPLFSFRQEFAWVWSSIVGAGLTVVIYFVWLEVLHRAERPIRLR